MVVELGLVVAVSGASVFVSPPDATAFAANARLRSSVPPFANLVRAAMLALAGVTIRPSCCGPAICSIEP